MAGYLPAAAAERAAQYAALGLSGPEALYRDVPESVRLQGGVRHGLYPLSGGDQPGGAPVHFRVPDHDL